MATKPPISEMSVFWRNKHAFRHPFRVHHFVFVIFLAWFFEAYRSLNSMRSGSFLYWCVIAVNVIQVIAFTWMATFVFPVVSLTTLPRSGATLTPEDKVMCRRFAYFVGVKDMHCALAALKDFPIDLRNLINATVFYPTDVQPNPVRKHQPQYVPYGEYEIIKALTAILKKSDSKLFLHHLDCTLDATVDAPLASNVTSESLGSAPFPVIIFSHDAGMHRHSSSELAMNLSSNGAIVLCVEHQDGSAAYARRATIAAPTLPSHYEPVKCVPGSTRSFHQRINELTLFLKAVRGGALHQALGLTCLNPDTLRVALCGHGIGGTTAMQTTINLTAFPPPGSPAAISAVVAFEFYPMMNFSAVRKGGTATEARQDLELPPLLALDGAHEQQQKERLQRRKQCGTLWRTWHWLNRNHANYYSGTDLDALGYLGPVHAMKKSVNRKANVLWHTRMFDFIEVALSKSATASM